MLFGHVCMLFGDSFARRLLPCVHMHTYYIHSAGLSARKVSSHGIHKYIHRYIHTYIHYAGIPACKVSPTRAPCKTFAYTPAPFDEYAPEADYATFDDFKNALVGRKCVCM